jgi:hypothetical protein
LATLKKQPLIFIFRIPEWKLQKYSSTQFKRHYGSMLLNDNEKPHGYKFIIFSQKEAIMELTPSFERR